MIKVWVDYYERDDDVRVFVNGYALCREASTIEIARKLAKDAGQEHLDITTYPDKNGLPRKMSHYL